MYDRLFPEFFCSSSSESEDETSSVVKEGSPEKMPEREKPVKIDIAPAAKKVGVKRVASMLPTSHRKKRPNCRPEIRHRNLDSSIYVLKAMFNKLSVPSIDDVIPRSDCKELKTELST